MAGADLANIINEAAILPRARARMHVDMADLDEAVDRVIGGLERKSRVLPRRSAISRPPRDRPCPVARLPQATGDKVTIIPRGVGALGATYQLPLRG